MIFLILIKVKLTDVYSLISNFSSYCGLPSAAPENLPVATKIANEVICLPMHHELSDEDINRVLELVVR